MSRQYSLMWLNGRSNRTCNFSALFFWLYLDPSSRVCNSLSMESKNSLPKRNLKPSLQHFILRRELFSNSCTCTCWFSFTTELNIELKKKMQPYSDTIICYIHLTNIWFYYNYTRNQVKGSSKRYSLPSFTQVIKAPNGQHVREADGEHLELADDLLTSHKEISLQEVVHGPYPVCQVHRVLPDLQEWWGTYNTRTWDYIKDNRIHEYFSHVDLKYTLKSLKHEVITNLFLLIS